MRARFFAAEGAQRDPRRLATEPGMPWVLVDAYQLRKVPITSAGSVTPNP